MIKASVLAHLTALALGVFSLVTAAGSNEPTVHIFGNSLTDIGRSKHLTLGLVPSSDFWDGRFSNGKVMSEYIGPLLGYATENWATGGATANNDYYSYSSFLGLHVPSTQDRINGVREGLADGMFPAGSNNMAYLEIGSNDLFAVADDLVSGSLSISDFTETLSDIIADQIAQLVKMNFRYVISNNMPAVYITPSVIDQGQVELSIRVGAEYNRLLAEKTAGLRRGSSDAVVGLFDVDGVFRVTASSPRILHTLGITNSTSACLDTFGNNTGSSSENTDPRSTCLDQDQFYFLDGLHPNRVIHRVLGYYYSEYVQALNRGSSFEPTEQNLLGLIHRFGLDRPFS
ncbi:hypothetical protein GGF46_002596 [Coemansia sp. RSA 552]|nr:hypothetical protein GGF46_002596 [Coemansia sp. RSA 552]